MPKTDPHIISTAVLSATCAGCGQRKDDLTHLHIVDREFYCPACCPKCKPEKREENR